MAENLTLWRPSTGLPIAQKAEASKQAIRHATSPQEAIKAARQLAGQWPHAKPPDADGYAATLAAVLSTYPLGVVRECVDPRLGLARHREFPPTGAAITEWCDKRLRWHMTVADYRPMSPREPERQFSEEHRATMRSRLQRLMHNIFDPKPTLSGKPAE